MGGSRRTVVLVATLGLTACSTGAIVEGFDSQLGIGHNDSSSGDGDSGGKSDGDDEPGPDEAGPGGDDEPADDSTGGDPGTGGTCGEADCGPGCGDGVIAADEDCEGTDLGGQTCIGLGYAGGTLGCADQGCTFDTSGCLAAVCGDGIVGGAEACDCGGGDCSAVQLQNQACTDLPAPTGGNYSGGSLGCDAVGCTLDESGCWACGDGAIDSGEDCDGANLGGASCTTLGHDAGALSCSSGCTFDQGACVDWVCGDAVCDPNEDSCSCPGDCPDDPNMCSTCECGSYGGACYCDDLCVEYGDCCANGPC